MYNSIDLDDIEAIRQSFNSVNKVANSICYFACIELGFKNVLYTNFYVSHLNFGQQLADGMNTDDLIQKYHSLYDKMVRVGRFDGVTKVTS